MSETSGARDITAFNEVFTDETHRYLVDYTRPVIIEGFGSIFEGLVGISWGFMRDHSAMARVICMQNEDRPVSTYFINSYTARINHTVSEERDGTTIKLHPISDEDDTHTLHIVRHQLVSVDGEPLEHLQPTALQRAVTTHPSVGQATLPVARKPLPIQSAQPL